MGVKAGAGIAGQGKLQPRPLGLRRSGHGGGGGGGLGRLRPSSPQPAVSRNASSSGRGKQPGAAHTSAIMAAWLPRSPRVTRWDQYFSGRQAVQSSETAICS